MAIDTLKVARRLREAGFSEPQAEAVVVAVQEATAAGDLATKADLDAVRTELKAEIAEFRAELKAEIADLRSELRQSELRLEAKLESIKADILNRVFGLILGALVVNIVAIVGAVLAVAKLAGH
jgi:DNA-binding transcriptional MerR regulator